MTDQRTISRKDFIGKTIVSAIALSLPFTTRAKDQEPVKPPPIKIDIVKEFVSVAHRNLDRVKEMLENDQQLLHVSYDWGGGDFETAIEAAGHMGLKEEANYLLEKGARYNIYLACMLGHLETVRNVLTFNAGLLNSKGPHGFTMLHHAKKGGEESKAVVEYLTSLGAKETIINFYVKK
jgi:hypothetical protein